MAEGDYSGTVGDVDLTRFDPGWFLTAFDWGRETTAEDGTTVREWDVVATEMEIEVAPGVFPSWTYKTRSQARPSAAAKATCCAFISRTHRRTRTRCTHGLTRPQWTD